MDLNQFSPQFFDVVRNASFETLGNFSSSPNCLYLSFAENETFLMKVCNKYTISAVVCTPELANNERLVNSGKGIAVCKKPRRSFYELHNWLADNCKDYIWESIPTKIGKNCKIDNTAVISQNGVAIGNNVTIEERVVIKSGSIIEDNTHICTGAIIGGENQIITKDINGNLFLVRQLGRCRISENAVIGYNSLIARGTFPYDETTIGEYTMVETGVEISHNSKIGKNCIITGQCQVCGNSVVGDNSRINPKSVISNQTVLGEDVTVDIGSVVVNNLKDHARVAGNFAIDHFKFLLWHRKKLTGK